MIPVAEKSRRLSIHRNPGGVLFGSTWVHHRSWEERRTHFYLGWWVLTLVTNRNARIDGLETPKISEEPSGPKLKIDRPERINRNQ